MDARAALLAWYRPRRSAYPWRARRDPYAVLVSEVMLQQTQASRVAPAFREFLRRFPTVDALSVAATAEVLRYWSGLGYNRRAVALHRASRAIVRDHGGRVPSDLAELRRLPGVGPYTAAAVASVGHGLPVAAVDTNVRRVVARWRLGVEPGEAPAGILRDSAGRWLDRLDPGGWNQALMDLGREVCRPVPRCAACPLARGCRYRRRMATAAGRVPPVRRAVRSQRFEGSSRQVRGAVVRALVGRGPLTFGALVRETGHPPERVAMAVAALSADGLVHAGPAALSGRPRGRVRIPAG